MKHQNLHTMIYALIAAILWGIIYTLNEKILTNISALNLIYINSIITTLLLTPYILYNKKYIYELYNINLTTTMVMLLYLVLGLISTYCIFQSINDIGAVKSSSIEITYPLFVVIFSYLILGTTINISTLLGGMIIFIGVYIVMKY